MKEVSYSPMMAEMLTYYGGRSTAFVLEDEGNLEYADEKYVRHLMGYGNQLSILTMLALTAAAMQGKSCNCSPQVGS